jgi:hypothetical protein
MKTLSRIAFTASLLLAFSSSLRAEFLVLRIRENTAESIWHWTMAVGAIVVVLTLVNSRSKGGQGN